MPKESRRDVAAPRRTGDSSRSAGSDTSSRRARQEDSPSDRKKVRSGDDERTSTKGDKAGAARDTRRSKRLEEPDAERSSKRARPDDAKDTPRRSSRRSAESDDEVPAPRTSKRRSAESDDEIPAPRTSKRRSAESDDEIPAPRTSKRRSADGDDDDARAKGPSKVLLVLVGIVVVAGLGGAGYYFSRPPDLPTLLAGLDKFKSPGPDYIDKARQHPSIKGLASFGTSAIAGCQAVLDDAGRKPDARVGAAVVLGMLKAEGAIPSMVRAIEVDVLAPMVAVALVDVGDNAISALLAAARDAKGAHAGRLVEAIGRHKSPSLVAKALGEIGSTHVETAARVKAVEELASLKTTDGAQILARLTLSDVDEVCVAAERGLDSQEDNQLVLASRKLITGDASDRRLAMLLVAGVGAGARELVEQGLVDSDVAVAIAATPGMATIIAGTLVQTDADKQSIANQRASLAERVKTLCGEAQKDEDVIQLGKAAGQGKLAALDEHFRAWMATGTPPQKIAAIEALSGFADGMIAGEFMVLAGDSDPKVADTASRALSRFFQRGRKDWRDFHYGGEKVPTGAAEWKHWWEEQKWIYEQRDLALAEKAKGTTLLQTRKYYSMKKASELFFTAQDRIIKIGEKKVAAGDRQGEITHLITELAGLVEMSMKNRPTGPEPGEEEIK